MTPLVQNATMRDMDPAEYLQQLDAALVGPRATKRGLLREAADHLDDARDAYVRAGLSEAEAGARAVADFGSVNEVAPAFQTTLAVASARRTAAQLLAILAIQPFLWDSGIAGWLGLSTAAVEPSGAIYHLLDAAVEYGGSIVMLTTVLLLVGAGIGNRWVPAGRRLAVATAWFSLGAATVLPLIGTGMTLIASGGDVGPWLLLVSLLMAPLAGVAVSARRTLAAA